MLIFYLACLLFGGILLGVSLLSGGGDIDGTDALDGGHADLHSLDTDSDFEFDSDTSLDHIEMSDADLSHDMDHPTDIVKFLSLRNVIYFTAFYGLTGTTLTLMSMPWLLTFISALGIGTLSWSFGHQLMKYLKNSESGQALTSNSFIGRTAKVVLPLRKDKVGKVLVRSNNEINELRAKVSDSADKDAFQIGEEVLIIDFSKNIYYVVSTLN